MSERDWLVLVGFFLVACGETKGGDAAATGTEGVETMPAASQLAANSSELTGAWYGSGPAYPDGDLCLIFCENGRLFSGDRPCTETDATDFDGYLMYSVMGTNFTANGPDSVQFSGSFELSETATFVLGAEDEQFTLPGMTRIAASSPLCTSDEPIWRGF